MPVILVFNAATFVWSAALISRIVLPAASTADPAASDEPASEAEPPARLWTEVTAGFRTIRSDRRLLLVVALVARRRSSPGPA